jgi:hypothetical protein
MGFNFQSSSTQQTLNDFNKVVNDAVFNVVTEGSTHCSGGNTINVQTGTFISAIRPDGTLEFQQCTPPNLFKTGSINIQQFVNNNCNLTVQATNNLQQNVQTQLTQDIKQWISTHLSNNQGWLTIASSIAIANNTTIDNVANDISNSLSANITTKCNAYLRASNDAVLTFCGEVTGGINIGQNILQTNLTNCLITNTVTAFQSNSIAQKIAQQTDTKLANTQEGLSTIAKYLIIAAIILGALIVIGIVLYLIFGNKSNLPAALQRYPSGGNQINPVEREEIEECLGPARRRLEERGIPPTKEALKPDVERCLIEKRAERREGVARVERQRVERFENRNEGRTEEFKGEGSRERFSEPRVAEETGRERFENRARYGTPNESVETLGDI